LIRRNDNEKTYQAFSFNSNCKRTGSQYNYKRIRGGGTRTTATGHKAGRNHTYNANRTGSGHSGSNHTNQTGSTFNKTTTGTNQPSEAYP